MQYQAHGDVMDENRDLYTSKDGVSFFGTMQKITTQKAVKHQAKKVCWDVG
jgi:hypothetical protein